MSGGCYQGQRTCHLVSALRRFGLTRAVSTRGTLRAPSSGRRSSSPAPTLWRACGLPCAGRSCLRRWPSCPCWQLRRKLRGASPPSSVPKKVNPDWRTHRSTCPARQLTSPSCGQPTCATPSPTSTSIRLQATPSWHIRSIQSSTSWPIAPTPHDFDHFIPGTLTDDDFHKVIASIEQARPRYLIWDHLNVLLYATDPINRPLSDYIFTCYREVSRPTTATS